MGRNILDPAVSKGIKLYHYTTFEGFLSILRSRLFWASDIRYMNDAKEYRLAYEYAEDLLNGNGITERIIKVLEKRPLYVVSLSEKGDNLGQWRGYTQPGNGISFSLSHSFYEKQCAAIGASIAKCTYDPKQQKQLTTNVIDTLKQYEASKGVTREKLAKQCLHWWTLYGGRMKHEAFREEDEWRVLAAGKKCTPKFRSGKSSIIPFTELKLLSGVPLELEEVIIGPSPNQDLARQAVLRFLEAEKITCKEVKNTSIPFRPW